MLPSPVRHEIDHRTIKLVVGVIAVSLAGLTSWFSSNGITSISASYYEDGWSRSIFIGFLFAISAFLLAYNGFSKPEMLLSKVASLAALGVALFPCTCDRPPPPAPFLHYTSAVTMFFILAFFCYSFYRRAMDKGHEEARTRAWIYAICGIAILLSMAVMAFDKIANGVLSGVFPSLIFWGEAIGLVAFGASWLTASRVLPGITKPSERFSPLAQHNPAD